MADRAPASPKLNINDANSNAKKGDGDAWKFIEQGSIVREPATVHRLGDVPKIEGNTVGQPDSLKKTDLRGIDGL